jgi:hypothetical protein
MLAEKSSILLNTSPKPLLEGVAADGAATSSSVGVVVESSSVGAAAVVVKLSQQVSVWV